MIARQRRFSVRSFASAAVLLGLASLAPADEALSRFLDFNIAILSQQSVGNTAVASGGAASGGYGTSYAAATGSGAYAASSNSSYAYLTNYAQSASYGVASYPGYASSGYASYSGSYGYSVAPAAYCPPSYHPPAYYPPVTCTTVSYATCTYRPRPVWVGPPTVAASVGSYGGGWYY